MDNSAKKTKRIQSGSSERTEGVPGNNLNGETGAVKPTGSRMSAKTRLEAEVKTHLQRHREIDTSDVTVSAGSKGHVKLDGQVDTSHAKNLAESIATQEVEKVKSVDNRLRFRRDPSEALD